MLAYASRDAGLLDNRAIAACDFEQPLELVGRLLDASMRRLRRRGLNHEYRSIEEQGPAPRGAITLSATIARLLPAQGKLAWTVDELLPDTPENRVLKATMRLLMSHGGIGSKIRARLRTHVTWLSGVRDISPREAVRVRVTVPRALPEYRPALRLAGLALENLLPDAGQEGSRWNALLQDPERMGDLFERFVRGFAAYEFEDRAAVSARQLSWDVTSASPAGEEIMPIMRTDVFVQWKTGAATVCECKFYEEPLAKHAWSATAKLRASHLYQLTAYLRATAREAAEKPSGLLLYARAGEPITQQYILEGYRTMVATLDLARDWPDIRSELLDVFRASRADEN